MVLVDTSVWIALYRGRASEIGERLWQLAATAIEHRATLFTLDSDFRVLTKDGLEIL